MVKIRLTRLGDKKSPFYRIVVADARAPREGEYIELLGTYDPLKNPAEIKLDNEKAKDWLKKGARPTDTVRSILAKQGVIEQFKAPAKACKKKEKSE